jgi:hypothetical protein
MNVQEQPGARGTVPKGRRRWKAPASDQLRRRKLVQASCRASRCSVANGSQLRRPSAGARACPRLPSGRGIEGGGGMLASRGDRAGRHSFPAGISDSASSGSSLGSRASCPSSPEDAAVVHEREIRGAGRGMDRPPRGCGGEGGTPFVPSGHQRHRRLPALRWDPGRPALLLPRAHRSSTNVRSRRWSGSGSASTQVRWRRRDPIRSQRGSVLQGLPALCWDPGHLALLLPRTQRSSTSVRSGRWSGSGAAFTCVRWRRRDAFAPASLPFFSLGTLGRSGRPTWSPLTFYWSEEDT